MSKTVFPVEQLDVMCVSTVCMFYKATTTKACEQDVVVISSLQLERIDISTAHEGSIKLSVMYFQIVIHLKQICYKTKTPMSTVLALFGWSTVTDCQGRG